MYHNYRVYSFSWTTCSHYAIRHCSIKESHVISSRTTSISSLPFVWAYIPFSPFAASTFAPGEPESVSRGPVFSVGLKTQPDPHCYTPRSLLSILPAHLLPPSAFISVWSFRANLLADLQSRCRRHSVLGYAHVVSFQDWITFLLRLLSTLANEVVVVEDGEGLSALKQHTRFHLSSRTFCRWN